MYVLLDAQKRLIKNLRKRKRGNGTGPEMQLIEHRSHGRGVLRRKRTDANTNKKRAKEEEINEPTNESCNIRTKGLEEARNK